MRLYRTDAIILKKMNFQENDRIISMFSPGKGKLKVIAKGSRKIKNRFSGSLETGNIVRATIYEKKAGELGFLSNCDLKESWSELRKDFEFTETFFYMLSVVEELIPEYESCIDAYNLLLNILNHYDGEKDIFNVITFFDINISRIIGVVPVFTKCAGCGGKIDGKSVAYSKKCGGVICENCAPKHPVSGHLSLGALKAMTLIGNGGMMVGGNVRLSESFKEDIDKFLYPFIAYHTGKDIKARGILRQMHLI